MPYSQQPENVFTGLDGQFDCLSASSPVQVVSSHSAPLSKNQQVYPIVMFYPDDAACTLQQSLTPTYKNVFYATTTVAPKGSGSSLEKDEILASKNSPLNQMNAKGSSSASSARKENDLLRGYVHSPVSSNGQGQASRKKVANQCASPHELPLSNAARSIEIDRTFVEKQSMGTITTADSIAKAINCGPKIFTCATSSAQMSSREECDAKLNNSEFPLFAGFESCLSHMSCGGISEDVTAPFAADNQGTKNSVFSNQLVSSLGCQGRERDNFLDSSPSLENTDICGIRTSSLGLHRAGNHVNPEIKSASIPYADCDSCLPYPSHSQDLEPVGIPISGEPASFKREENMKIYPVNVPYGTGVLLLPKPPKKHSEPLHQYPYSNGDPMYSAAYANSDSLHSLLPAFYSHPGDIEIHRTASSSCCTDHQVMAPPTDRIYDRSTGISLFQDAGVTCLPQRTDWIDFKRQNELLQQQVSTLKLQLMREMDRNEQCKRDYVRLVRLLCDSLGKFERNHNQRLDECISRNRLKELQVLAQLLRAELQFVMFRERSEGMNMDIGSDPDTERFRLNDKDAELGHGASTLEGREMLKESSKNIRICRDESKDGIFDALESGTLEGESLAGDNESYYLPGTDGDLDSGEGSLAGAEDELLDTPPANHSVLLKSMIPPVSTEKAEKGAWLSGDFINGDPD